MITNLRSVDAGNVALIHSQMLSGDFLPSLGQNFLRAFYEGAIGLPGVYCFAWKERDKVYGFVIGTRDSGKFFNEVITSRFFMLFFYLLIAIFRNPLIIKNVLETFLYPQKDTGPKAELVVIAVLDSFQGRGIGRKLVESLEKAFLEDGIIEYKLTVHADKKAVKFYEHLGYQRSSSFSLYAKIWYVFVKKISHGPKEKKRQRIPAKPSEGRSISLGSGKGK